MERITVEHIDMEMERIIENCPMTRENLKMLKLLHDVRCVVGGEMSHDLTMEEAEQWVHGMNPPGKWSMDQASTLMKHHGYHHNKCEFYAVMNMISSDYGDTLGRYGVDRPEVIAELAHNFLDDGDAVDGKTASYYRHIARKS